MSIATTRPNVHDIAAKFHSSAAEQIEKTIAAVQNRISPVWPIRDYVAVNPYGGFSSQKFLDARDQLARLSDCETIMPFAYYQQRFQAGKFGLDELRQAIDEMVADKIPGAESMNANAVYKLLDATPAEQVESTVNTNRIRLISQHYDQCTGANWDEIIRDEVGKHCAAHYDEGQAGWSSPYKDLPLYQAWRSTASVDRHVELLGLKNLRNIVADLPQTPEAAIFVLLHKANVPPHQWTDYLTCVALSLPGWSAWTKFKTIESSKRGFENPDFAALLAMRIAYDVAVAETFEFEADFHTSPPKARAPK